MPRATSSILDHNTRRRIERRKDRPVVCVGEAHAAAAWAASNGLPRVQLLRSMVEAQALDATLPWRIVEVYGAHESHCIAARQELERRMMSRTNKAAQ